MEYWKIVDEVVKDGLLLAASGIRMLSNPMFFKSLLGKRKKGSKQQGKMEKKVKIIKKYKISKLTLACSLTLSTNKCEFLFDFKYFTISYALEANS